MDTVETVFTSSGKRIAARLRIPRNAEKSPGIVINHGYSGNKEEYDEMAGYLCKKGFCTLQFDSRGCGESQAIKGRMMCGTEWLEDAVSAVSFLSEVESVDVDRMGYTGCSMGGAVTLYMAAMDKRVKCAVAMAPYAYRETFKKNWLRNRNKEEYEAFCMSVEKNLCEIAENGEPAFVGVPHALGLDEKDTTEYLAFRNHHPELVREVPLESVYNSTMVFEPSLYVKLIEIPTLIIHGDADSIIPIESSYRLLENKNMDFVLIEGGDHMLPASDQKGKVFESIKVWFKDNL